MIHVAREGGYLLLGVNSLLNHNLKITQMLILKLQTGSSHLARLFVVFTKIEHASNCEYFTEDGVFLNILDFCIRYNETTKGTKRFKCLLLYQGK